VGTERAAREIYAEQGYWVSPVLFDADEVTRFLSATERVVAGDHRGGRPPVLALPFDPGPNDLRKIDDAWWADPDLAALACDQRLGRIAADLLGAEAVRLWQDQLLVKPPGGPEVTTIGWHQDWASWDTVASHPAFVTAWVAFDDVDDGNGAMQMLPGSHHWGLVPGGSNFFATDRDAQLATLGIDEVPEPASVVLRAGQVSFHHPLTFHGSGANTSDRMRRSLAIHYVDASVTAVSEPGIWQHYNLAMFLERGGQLGEAYRFDDLCPLVPTGSRS
jgi:ectoine hydroxylase-related dioxygenase (phytanoyl-CoA dioxygenase family)